MNSEEEEDDEAEADAWMNETRQFPETDDRSYKSKRKTTWTKRTRKADSTIAISGVLTDAEKRSIDPLDADINPYPETALGQSKNKTKRITFHEQTHTYHLVDARGFAYSDLIVSGSKVIKYMGVYADVVNSYEPEVAGESVEDRMWTILHRVSAQLRAELHFGGHLLADKVEKKQIQAPPRTKAAVAASAANARAKQRRSLQGDLQNDFTLTLRNYIQYLCEETTTLELPFAYATRLRLFAKFTKKNFAYFIPSWVYARIESWIQRRKRTPAAIAIPKPFDLSDPDEYEAYQEVYTHLHAMEFPPYIRSELFVTPVPLLRIEADSAYFDKKYTIPRTSGTQLHSYIEHRLRGGSKEDCLLDFPLAEIEDVENAELFLEDYPPGTFAHMEYRTGSLRHKYCGSLDAVYIHPDTGIWYIFDWKRSPLILDPGKKIIHSRYLPGQQTRKQRYHVLTGELPISNKFEIDDNGVYHVVYQNLTKSSHVYGYMVQAATYRKLLLLEGRRVSTRAYLGIFDPAVRGYVKLELRLDKGGKSGCLPPTEYVEWVFHHREMHLQLCYFGETL